MVINLNAPVNWQPKVAGIVSAVALFILANPGDFEKWPMVLHVASYVMAGGLAALGLTVKQSNVTGGNVVNSGNDPIKVVETHSVKT